MATHKLVIVESPAKAHTIGKFLGRGYKVEASQGHVRDLPKSQIGVDIEHGFTPKYITIRGRGEILDRIRKEAKNASKIFLATDPDREGEAISWHLATVLGLDEKDVNRVEFFEITSKAVKSAIKSSRPIDMDLVNAQQARRVLDRLVGYKISPLLWAKVRKGLSAGRVQSVATAMICDREHEIDEFVPEEFWTVQGRFKTGAGEEFTTRFVSCDGEGELRSAEATEKVVERMKKAAFTISAVRLGERRKYPAPPFTTSNLQQEASRKLGFTTLKTMQIAQQLYEGVDIEGEGTQGLVSYIRTDSTRVSDEAIAAVREMIGETYGADYLPEEPNHYKSRKSAQDAHEAIRPTDMARRPEQIKSSLTRDQFKLYKLIYARFVASQMTPAVYDTVSVDIAAGPRFLLRAKGSTLKFAGFTAVYAGADATKKEKDVVLPELAAGDALEIAKTLPQQHFTEPPPRYNDASIVKTLEEKEIGRPSTYAPIIETIQARGYVQRVDKHFQPTELGFVVVDMLQQYFKDIVNVKFTADLENELDEIAEGKVEKNVLLRDFYGPFETDVEKADEAIGHVELPVEVSDVQCELCGRMMVVKQGRYGKFLACPGFPECRNTKPLLKDTGVKCPKCGGSIVERRTRRGRMFYGCQNYPDCDYTTWDTPLKDTCPECGAFMLKHHFKNGRTLLYCSNDACKTRIDNPINEELEKIKKRMEARKAAAEKKAAEAAAKKDK